MLSRFYSFIGLKFAAHLERHGFTFVCTDHLAAVKAENARLRETMTCFMEHYEVYNLREEDFDEIEKRAVALWGILKERDDLRQALTYFKDQAAKPNPPRIAPT